MTNVEFPPTGRIGGMRPEHREVLQTMHLALLDTLQEHSRLDSLYQHPELKLLLSSRSHVRVLLTCSSWVGVRQPAVHCTVYTPLSGVYHIHNCSHLNIQALLHTYSYVRI